MQEKDCHRNCSMQLLVASLQFLPLSCMLLLLQLLLARLSRCDHTHYDCHKLSHFTRASAKHRQQPVPAFRGHLGFCKLTGRGGVGCRPRGSRACAGAHWWLPKGLPPRPSQASAEGLTRDPTQLILPPTGHWYCIIPDLSL